jgi:hypothetical protein
LPLIDELKFRIVREKVDIFLSIFNRHSIAFPDTIALDVCPNIRTYCARAHKGEAPWRKDFLWSFCLFARKSVFSNRKENVTVRNPRNTIHEDTCNPVGNRFRMKPLNTSIAKLKPKLNRKVSKVQEIVGANLLEQASELRKKSTYTTR